MSVIAIAIIKKGNSDFFNSPSRRYDDSLYKSPTGSISTRLDIVTAMKARTISFAPFSDKAYLCLNFSIMIIYLPFRLSSLRIYCIHSTYDRIFRAFP